jgi:hypothetical protein
MPKISFEGTLGLVLEIALGILDHLHVREPLIVWSLFLFGLFLISDAVIRSDWAARGKSPTQRGFLGMVPVIVAFGLFGWWIFGRTRQVPAPPQAQTQPAPQVKPPTSTQVVAPPPPQHKKAAPGGINTNIKQGGHHNTANPGGINNSDIHPEPCSVIQNGGSNNSASPTCVALEATYGNLRQRAKDLSDGLRGLLKRHPTTNDPNEVLRTVHQVSDEYILSYDHDVRQVIEDFGKINIRDPALDRIMAAFP